MAVISCRCVYKNPLQSLGRMHSRSIINHLTWLGVTEPSVIHTRSTSKTLHSLAVTSTKLKRAHPAGLISVWSLSLGVFKPVSDRVMFLPYVGDGPGCCSMRALASPQPMFHLVCLHDHKNLIVVRFLQSSDYLGDHANTVMWYILSHDNTPRFSHIVRCLCV